MTSGGGGGGPLLHTPAMAGLGCKRQKLGEESGGDAPPLAQPSATRPHHQHQHQQPHGGSNSGGGGGGGGAPGVFHSPSDAALGSRLDESAGFAGVRRLACASGDQWQAFLR